MSVEPVARKTGRVWRVRWRDEHGQERSRVLGKKVDADAFDADVKRRKRLGQLDQYEQGEVTLATFVEEWWRVYALPNLAERTLNSYAGLWDRHVLPYLGAHRLRDINAQAINEMMSALRAKGTGEPTVYRALMILSGVMQKAYEWGRVADNPVRRVPKPRIRRVRQVRPFSDAEIEALRDACWRARDRAIIGIMAYAGLRPQELFALDWEDVGDRVLYIDKATAPKQGIKTTKNREDRTVTIGPNLARVLAEWGEQTEEVKGPVITKYNGLPYNDATWGTWHRDVWKPITETLSIEARPYDLRHTFVSRMIADGASIVDVAKQAGHTPTMALEVYGHVFDAEAAA